MIDTLHLSDTAKTDSLCVGQSIDCGEFETIRRRMMLEFCKWDAQVGDVSTLAEFPLILAHQQWVELKSLAESLSRETLAMEARLLDRPDLVSRLGVPRQLQRLLQRCQSEPVTPAACRVMRFDFHPTTDGWRVSEVNSDVPGGFTEASAFTALVANHFPGLSPAGDPQLTFVKALARTAIKEDGPVVLLSAPGFMEDHQVVSGLARRLNEHGTETLLANPRDIHWIAGRAKLSATGSPVSAIVRFYQGEWLAHLSRNAEWKPLFIGGVTPVANPGCAIISESKRLPLVWDDLGVDCPIWKELLPETREPRDVAWQHDEGWLLKSAYCNTGDSVTIRSLTNRHTWRMRRLDVLFHPRGWIAQRRFETEPISTPRGSMFPCAGVYTIDGRACGIYGRLSPGPVINYAAIDVAVLVENAPADGEQ